MSNVYESHFRETLARRTLLAAVALLGIHYLVQIFLFSIAGRFDWLDAQFYLQWFPYSLPFITLLLIRLRHLIHSESGLGMSFVKLENFLCALVWISATVVFLYGYFNTFVPAYWQVYLFPEKRWGPPVLREQPFYLISFGIWFGLLAYLRMAWNVIPSRTQDFDSLRGFRIFAQKRIQTATPRIVRLLLYSLIGLAIECTMTAPPSAIAYTSVVSIFRPLRRMVHSFRDFIDPRLWIHLIWAGFSVGFLFCAVDWVIEWFFSGCFHICRQVPDPTGAILAGLQSNQPMVRDQASLELSHLVEEEPEWRKSIFDQFITRPSSSEEMLVSRTLALYFIERLRLFQRHLEVMNKDLYLFSSKMESASITHSSSSSSSRETEARITSSANTTEMPIFSPIRRTTLERFLFEDDGAKGQRPQESSKQPRDPAKQQHQELKQSQEPSFPWSKKDKKLIPDILEIKPTNNHPLTHIPTTRQEPFSPESSAERFTNVYLSWTARIFTSVAHTFPGRIYAAWSCEVIKGWWWGTEPQTLIWLLDALTTILASSIQEDIHGQIQFLLNDILLALLELGETLEKFIRLPTIRGRRMLDDLFGPEGMSPTERKGREVEDAIIGSLEIIGETFGTCWKELNLAPLVREKMRKFMRMGVPLIVENNTNNVSIRTESPDKTSSTLSMAHSLMSP